MTAGIATDATVSAVIAQSLAAAGVRDVFGVLGAGNIEAVAHLVHTWQGRFHPARHEAGALAMADGFARARTAPGVTVCALTQGPGLTNALTPLVAAHRAGSPILILCGEVPEGDLVHVQRLEQRALLGSIGIRVRAIRSARTASADVAAAIREVALGRGPILLAMPLNVIAAAAGADPSPPRTLSTTPSPARRRPPEAHDVEEVVRLLHEAERPLLLAGRGATAARASIEALAESTGALLGTTLPAKGLFGRHAHHVGVVGGFSSVPVRERLAAVDLVVAFGASLNPFTTDRGTLFGGARLVHVDVDPLALGRHVGADLLIEADAAATARVLERALAARKAVPPTAPPRLPRGPFPTVAGTAPAAGDGRLDPRRAAAVCDALLDRPRTVVVGVGHFAAWPVWELEAGPDDLLIVPWEFGAVGVALSTGIGAALARPDRTTVVFEGDGGLLMSLSELDTAARTAARLSVVVFDDGGYGAEARLLTDAGLPDDLAWVDTPDLAAVAASLGVPSFAATDEPTLRAALTQAAGVMGPALVHVPVTRAVTQRIV